MAGYDPNQDRQDRNLEEPGDTNSADIVGRTGEQMPKQSHDGIDDDDRAPRPTDESGKDDEDLDGYPV